MPELMAVVRGGRRGESERAVRKKRVGIVEKIKIVPRRMRSFCVGMKIYIIMMMLEYLFLASRNRDSIVITLSYLGSAGALCPPVQGSYL